MIAGLAYRFLTGERGIEAAEGQETAGTTVTAGERGRTRPPAR